MGLMGPMRLMASPDHAAITPITPIGPISPIPAQPRLAPK